MQATDIQPAVTERPAYWISGLLLAAAGVLAFSVRPVIIKLAYGYGVDAVTLLMLRMLFSLPFFLAVAVWSGARRGGVPMTGRTLAATMALGITSYYVASFLDFLGLQYVSAGIGRLLLFLYPTIVVVLSALFLSKPIRGREVASLVISYIGVALVLSSEWRHGGSDIALGAALVFGGAFCYAVYLVAGSRLVERVGSMRFTAYGMTAASVCCIAQFVALRPFSALDLPWQVYALSVLMAVACTVLPVFMTAEALRRVGANTVALLGALGPVSAAALGALILGEAVTPAQVAGAVLVMVGVLLISLRRRAAP